jgi:hypothetical protein
MKWFVAVIGLFTRWWGIDQIRVTKQTGRIGMMVPGDRFVWHFTIYEVHRRECLVEAEYESEIALYFHAWDPTDAGPKRAEDSSASFHVRALASPTPRLIVELVRRLDRTEVREPVDLRDLCVLNPITGRG